MALDLSIGGVFEDPFMAFFLLPQNGKTKPEWSRVMRLGPGSGSLGPHWSRLEQNEDFTPGENLIFSPEASLRDHPERSE